VTVGAEWWREAVVYQVYPRSFQDSNGDGIGDLEGIIQRLDYLNDGTERSLGIDAIWLSPTFPSPMKDFGYDVSDYCGVHPDFGDMATMDRLIAECHRRGIRLLLDYVPNHSSEEHPWFIESRSSKQSAKRDWYIWREPGPGGERPNNWRSVFGGAAWTLDEPTGQFYLHSFLREQPDLNWRNPELVRAMHDVLRFWFERGIDGFRIDVMGMIVKHPKLADNPPNPEWTGERGERGRLLQANSRNYPDVFPAVKAIRRVFDEFPEKMAVGEVFGTADEVANYYGGEALDGLHLAFNFQFIHEKEPAFTPWDATALRRIVANAEAALPAGAQPCYALGNHDRSRFISRYNADGRGLERARAAAIMLLALRNMPFIYYGEEIGMEDVDIPEEQLKDPARIRTTGRDPERTPMQWDGTPGRGFSTVEPWLPYGRADRNVAAQTNDKTSLVSLYRRAIRVRKAEPALLRGAYRELRAPEGVFAFVRSAPGARDVYAVINTSTEAVSVGLPVGGDVLVATHDSGPARLSADEVMLPPLGAALIGANRR
jgi:alpha-glucosidase